MNSAVIQYKMAEPHAKSYQLHFEEPFSSWERRRRAGYKALVAKFPAEGGDPKASMDDVWGQLESIRLAKKFLEQELERQARYREEKAEWNPKRPLGSQSPATTQTEKLSAALAQWQSLEAGVPADRAAGCDWEAAGALGWRYASEALIDYDRAACKVLSLGTRQAVALRRLCRGFAAEHPALAGRCDLAQLVSLGRELAEAAAQDEEMLESVKKEFQPLDLSAMLGLSKALSLA